MFIILLSTALAFMNLRQNVVTAQTGDLTCFYQYVLYKNNCYRYYKLPLLNYAQALKACRYDGADLASIHNVLENGFLTTFNQKGFLIGLQYDFDTQTEKWSDGTFLNYTNYAGNFIIGRDYFGYCAKNVEGIWYNAECDIDKLEFVCKRKAAQISPTSNSECPNVGDIYYTPGMIVSPGYPSEYDLDALSAVTGCYYKIAAKNYHKLVIKIEEVLVEEDTGSIIIYKEWEPEDANQVAEVDSRFVGGELIVDANLALLRLSGSRKGSWKITTSSITINDTLIAPPVDACPYSNIIYTDLKPISSPGYPNMYQFEVDVMEEGCRYKLAAGKGQYIKITFDEIYMEDDTGSVDVYRQWEATEESKILSFTNRHTKSSFFVDSNAVLIHVRNTPRGRFLISWSGIGADSCELGWKYFNGSCYYADNTQMDFFNSEAFCESHSSHLIYIQTEEEQEFVKSFEKSPYNGAQFWIGLYYDTKWQWLDGSEPHYTRWYQGQPDYSPGSSPYCAYLDKSYFGEWMDQNCYGVSGTLCEHDSLNSTLTPPNGSCPDLTTVFSNSKPVLSPGYPEMYSFPALAKPEGCYYKLQAKNGHYIRIKFVDIVMENDIGSIDVYKGWEKTGKNKMFSYKKQYLGSTFTIDSEQTLIHICNSSLERYMITWTEILTDKCSTGWSYFNGSCYYPNPELVHFDTSKAYCEARSSHLVYLETPEEGDFINYGNGDSYFGTQTWIGLTYDGTTWLWLDGTKPQYSAWYPGRPDFKHGSAPFCTYLWSDYMGYWFDWGCSDVSGTVCEHETRETQ